MGRSARLVGGQIIDTIFDLLVLVRWIHFTSVFAMFGSAVFRLALPENAAAIALPGRRLHTVARIVQVAAAFAAASGLGWVALTVVNMTGGVEGLDVATLHAFFLETDFGSIEIARLVLLLLLVGAAMWPLAPGRRIAILGAASGVLLVSQAWLGHAAEGGSTWRGAAMLAAYAVHVLAGAVWVGGLVPLLVAVRALKGRGERPALVAVLARVSTVATTAVVLIVASGVVNTAFRVGGDLALLWSTPYGHVLGVKLGLVALMLVFAGYNRIVALPRLRSATDGAAQTAGGGLPASLGLELTAGVLVLAAAAVLGITPPPQ